MSSSSDSSQVKDTEPQLSLVDFAKRQLAVTERQMLSAIDLADLIDLAMTGIRQLSGGSQVEIWLHDPVDELDRHLDSLGVASGTVRLFEDSYDFVSLYSEDQRDQPLQQCSTHRVVQPDSTEQTLLLPVMDHDSGGQCSYCEPAVQS